MTFTSMDKSCVEDWERINEKNLERRAHFPNRLRSMLENLDSYIGGFGVSQLHHALHTATVAYRDGASDEMVVAALLHDVCKPINEPNHGPMAAELIRPYVSNITYNVIYTHELFVDRFQAEVVGGNTHLREPYRSEPWFDAAVIFADQWDQAAFDPKFNVMQLEEFQPLLEGVFGRTPKCWWR
ncbi:MAG: metal-dependent phosphohydrolase [Pseudomonadota bacterium]